MRPERHAGKGCSWAFGSGTDAGVSKWPLHPERPWGTCPSLPHNQIPASPTDSANAPGLHSPVTSEQMLKQPKYFIFQNKNQFQSKGWPTGLINKWATMPKRPWQAKLLTSLVRTLWPWLPRPVPHNDLGRISLMQKLPLGLFFWLPGPRLSEADTSCDFGDTVSQLNLRLPFLFPGAKYHVPSNKCSHL